LEHIKFSEITNRLRRNLMAAAFLIVGLAGFDIKITKVTSSGIGFENVNTDVLLIILALFLFYHVIAFCLHAFEEYKVWELKLVSKIDPTFVSATETVELAGIMKSAGETLKNVTKNGGLLMVDGQTVIQNEDAIRMIEASKAAETYGKRLKNFPTITRVRFWGWDIGVALAAAVIAEMFRREIIPSGLLGKWFL